MYLYSKKSGLALEWVPRGVGVYHPPPDPIFYGRYLHTWNGGGVRKRSRLSKHLAESFSEDGIVRYWYVGTLLVVG